MNTIDEMIGTLQNELMANRTSWTFGDMCIQGLKRKGNNKLIVKLDGDAEITIRFKANGKKAKCGTCKEKRPGWPHWWKNINAITGVKGLNYSCGDCVQAARRDKGEGTSD